MGDRHLEAAAGKLFEDFHVNGHSLNDFECEVAAGMAVTAYLDSLLGDLPEEKRDELTKLFMEFTQAPGASATAARLTAESFLRAFVLSLRDSLASGTGGQNEG